MTRYRALFDGAIPGGNLGGAFTASIAERAFIPQSGETYIDSVYVSIKVTTSVAAVTLSNTLSTLNPFVWKANEPRIQMRGQDMFALSTAFYNQQPEALGFATGNDNIVMSVRIPVWEKIKPAESYSWYATFNAVTNVAGQVLRVGARATGTTPTNGRIDAREIPYTSAASTGIQQVTPKLPKIGKLRGILVFSNTIPTVSADTSTVQRLYLDGPNARLVEAGWGDLSSNLQVAQDSNTTGSAVGVMLRNYGYLDLSDDPIDLIANDVSLSIDSEVVSDTARFIPIIEMPQ